MSDDKFEWNGAKAEANAKAHGITFQDTCQVFADKSAIWDDDLDSSWNEDRFRVIGQVDARIVVVSYTYREDDNGKEVVRLISARPATKRERNDYYHRQAPA